ncbi:hypothetical protein L917_08918 [Phytophthora nicotianae]|uniref:Uncharacterized protein n=1 Tax=Phytophthora nicotianae TaxID=4792 RepID=W2IZY9_PHYNI|nr:hypothetical protein L916_08984 [Phytophthora nicotianae]ETL92834.1 hypothetical protein L917_08918 [Phytophthora nicotianae]
MLGILAYEKEKGAMALTLGALWHTVPIRNK